MWALLHAPPAMVLEGRFACRVEGQGLAVAQCSELTLTISWSPILTTNQPVYDSKAAAVEAFEND